MAQAVEQHTAVERWTLEDLLRYLTEDLGYAKGVAVYTMNQRYLDGQLQLEKQECVRDGEPYGDAVTIDAEFGHLELDRHGRMRVVPRIKLWREVRYRIREECDARAIWPPHPRLFQTAADQQPKDKAGPVEAEADDGLSAGQPPQESKAEGWQVRRVKQALKVKFPPDGCPPLDLSRKIILDRVNEFFRLQDNWKPASRDSLDRATGRRRA